ncbi:survival of motor neuron protein isoform X1 [Nasonia vitripennis]|uniref:Tudor domain-containing protein n=1 Tax=Nasonia vitripennis TaxID=7425 RepID=A0A7M7G1Z8_NASVI|nr:survival of motor neuron protein isoform X1 [Nasonia vitripennis]
MAEDDNVLFVRGGGNSSSDDVWDDSALVKAYDKAVNLAKEEVFKRIGLKSENNGAKHKKPQSQKPARQAQKAQTTQKKWVIGSPCRAVYSEDGELYEAVIKEIFENTGKCVVKFIGYNNTETVELSSLLESEGLQSQIAQKKEAISTESNVNSMDFEEASKMNGVAGNQMDCESDEFHSLKNMYVPGPSFDPAMGSMPPAPPLPPQLMARLPENDADALSSMLMSWYISGFHTGYYHGLKQAQSNQHRRKT